MATDPRLTAVARKLGVNVESLRASILRSLYLQRVQNGNVRDVVGFLNDDVLPDLLGEMQKRIERVKRSSQGLDRGPLTTERLTEMVDAVSQVLQEGLGEAAAKMVEQQVLDLGVSETAWQTRTLDRLTSPFGVEFSAPSPALVKQLARSGAPIGKTVREMFDGISRSAAEDVVAQVRVGIASGEGADKMIERVRGTVDAHYEDGTFEKVRRQAEAIVRTSNNYAQNRAREAVFEENSDVVDRVQLVATLDSRTSAICRAYDGQVFPVNEGPRPPFHPNCRTMVVPVTKSWEELGLGDEFEEGDERLRLRESMDGEVPASMSYEDWLRDLEETDPARVTQILGPARAELWRSGEVASVRDFVDDKGRVLTLDELDELT